MLFNSLDFALFLALCLGIHALLFRRARNGFLLLASYVFYGAWDWRFLGLIWLSTLVDFFVARGIERARRSGAGDSAPRAARRLLLVSLVVNLGVLATFKYAGFFADSLAQLLGALGLEVPRFALAVVLPVGISFYTFQTLGYTVDVYRGHLPASRRLDEFALYVAFFPQLVAGPIERASRLLPQIRGERRATAEGVASGAWLVLWGTFKKVVVADNLAAVVDAVHAADAQPTGPEAWLAMYAFAFQILCDFSGYTDVARGVARLLGFELMLNFRRPYFAANPVEFWRRWHISLSTWLRDYLYIPLGGNRGGPRRTGWNLLTTMVLGGLWHGAAWTFVLWGLIHGTWLVLHRALKEPLARVGRRLSAAGPVGVPWKLLCIAVTFHVWSFSMVFFRAESVGRAGELLATMVSDARPGLVAAWIGPFLFLIAPVLAMHLWQAARDDDEPAVRAPLPVRTLLYAATFLGIVLLGEDHGQPFIYFQF